MLKKILFTTALSLITFNAAMADSLYVGIGDTPPPYYAQPVYVPPPYPVPAHYERHHRYDWNYWREHDHRKQEHWDNGHRDYDHPHGH